MQDIQTKLNYFKLQYPAQNKEMELMPQFINQDEKLLHILIVAEKIKNDLQYWLCAITDKKLIMLNKDFLKSLKTKIIPFEKINLCEKDGSEIILNIAGERLKLKIQI